MKTIPVQKLKIQGRVWTLTPNRKTSGYVLRCGDVVHKFDKEGAHLFVESFKQCRVG